MEVVLGLLVFFVLSLFVFLLGSLFALTVYPLAAFSGSLLVFFLFAWSYSSSQNKKKWIRRNFGVFVAFCGYFILYCFAYFCF